MGHAQRDNGPCDSRHSRAYCPVLYLAPARLLPDSRPTPARLLLESCPQRGALCPDGPRSPTAWTPYACRGRSEAARELARVLNGCPRTQRAFPFRYRSRPCRRGAPPAEGIVRHCFSVFSVFSVFSCHSLPLALRCVGPARRGAVLYGSASNLSPVVGPARRGTACGTTSGGAREPGCRRTAHCRQRRFASSTAVSPILLRAESRRMGETAVDVAKVRSRSRTPRTHERAVPKRQPARSNSSWPRPPERPSTTVLSAPGLDDSSTTRTETYRTSRTSLCSNLRASWHQ